MGNDKKNYGKWNKNWHGKSGYKPAKSTVQSVAKIYGAQTTTVGGIVKPNEKGLLYRGGGNLHFLMAKDAILERINQAGLTKFIKLPSGQNENGDWWYDEHWGPGQEPNVADIVEKKRNVFLARMTVEKAEQQEYLLDLEDRHDAGRLDNDEFKDTTRAVKNKLFELENSEEATLERYAKEAREEHAVWKREAETYERECKELFQIFKRSLNDATLTLVRDTLNSRRFNEAWDRICRLHLNNSINSDEINAVCDLIENLVFNPEDGMVEHVATIERLFQTQADINGSRAPDNMVRRCLVRSLQKSTVAKVFEPHIAALKHTRTTFTDLVKALQGVWDEWQAQKIQQEMRGEGKSTDGPRDTQSAAAHVATAQDTRTECGTCGKKHRGKCWKTVKCYRCNKMGHYAKDCTSKKGGGTDGDQGGSAGQEKNEGKGSKSSSVVAPMFTNKNREYIKVFIPQSKANCVDEILQQLKAAIPAMELAGACQVVITIGDALVTPEDTSERSVRYSEADHPVSVRVMGAHLLAHLTDAVMRATGNQIRLVIVDSGATRHMTNMREMIVNMHEASGEVTLGGPGRTLAIVGVGRTRVKAIGAMLYVPDLSITVLSVSQFLLDGMSVVFDSINGCGVVDCATGEVVLSGYMHNNLFYVNERYVHQLCGGVHQCAAAHEEVKVTTRGGTHIEPEVPVDTGHDAPMNVAGPHAGDPLSDESSTVESRLSGASAPGPLNLLERIHRNMGHASEGKIKRAVQQGLVECPGLSYDDIRELRVRNCFDCAKGRMKALPRKPSKPNTYEVMEKVAFDYKGKFPVESYHRKTGFILFSDRASGYVTVCPVKRKSEATKAMEWFYTQQVLRYGWQLRKLQCDAENVNLSKTMSAWLVQQGVYLQHSPPHVHDKNGQVERAVQSVMDKARTMMASYNVPDKYWEFAVECACYCINRLPSEGRDKTPVEAVTGQKPDITKMVPFYMPGVYHRTKEERKGKAWEWKAAPCRMLGYSEECEGAYIVLCLTTRTVLVRTNCMFGTDLTPEELVELYPEFENAHEDPSTSRVPWDEVIIDDDDDDIMEEAEEPVTPIVVTKDDVRMDVDDEDGDTTEESMSEDSLNLSHLDKWWTDCVYAMQEVLLAEKDRLVLPENPKDVASALQLPDGELWREAIVTELSSFLDRGTWGDADQNGRGMKTKLLLKYQFDNDFKLKRKARLVVCGYSQIKGLDYTDTFSPTTNTSVVFLLLHIASVRRYSVGVFDISAAYLEGKADCKMYAWLPPEITASGTRHRVEILGNWYGEKQAGRIWHFKLDGILKAMGFSQCPMHPCLYSWCHDSDVILLTVHVDDGIMASNNPALYKQFMEKLQESVRKAKFYESPRKFLGMELFPLEDGRFRLTQESYIKEHFGDYQKVVDTPICVTYNLRKQPPEPSDLSLLGDTGRFRCIADRTRPDILAGVGEVSRGGDKNPSQLHLKSAERIKHFLNCTSSAGLSIGGRDPIQFFGYCDAAYVTDGDAKSRIGGAFFLGSYAGAFDCFSRTSMRPAALRKCAGDDPDDQNDSSTVSHSSTEAEIKAIDEAVRLMEYWTQILDFLDIAIHRPLRLFVDNKSASELCRVMRTTHAVKHINMRIRYIYEKINEGLVGLHFIPGERNVADILTKILPANIYARHATTLLDGHNGVLPDDPTTTGLHCLDASNLDEPIL